MSKNEIPNDLIGHWATFSYHGESTPVKIRALFVDGGFMMAMCEIRNDKDAGKMITVGVHMLTMGLTDASRGVLNK